MTSVLINTKANIEIPHNMYPPQINIFLLPILSDKAPISMVVTVAATALADTIVAMSIGFEVSILKR